MGLTKIALSLDRAVPYQGPHAPHRSKTDIKFRSIWRILFEEVSCLHHPPWGWYMVDHPLPESRKFDFSKLKWRRTNDRFRSVYPNLSSTRQVQGLDCYSVRYTVVWLKSSRWSAQVPRAVHGLLESLVGTPRQKSTWKESWFFLKERKKVFWERVLGMCCPTVREHGGIPFNRWSKCW